jgi:uncharacterized protein YlxP (DUF503 family)
VSRRTGSAHVAVLLVELELPACHSLKDKRSSLKPLLVALQREFSCSAAELDRLDEPRQSVIACAVVANDGRHVQRVLQRIPGWIEGHRPDLEVVDSSIEMR